MNRKLWSNEEKASIVLVKVALGAVGMAKSSYYYQPLRKMKPWALD